MLRQVEDLCHVLNFVSSRHGHVHYKKPSVRAVMYGLGTNGSVAGIGYGPIPPTLKSATAA